MRVLIDISLIGAGFTSQEIRRGNIFKLIFLTIFLIYLFAFFNIFTVWVTVDAHHWDLAY